MDQRLQRMQFLLNIFWDLCRLVQDDTVLEDYLQRNGATHYKRLIRQYLQHDDMHEGLKAMSELEIVEFFKIHEAFEITDDGVVFTVYNMTHFFKKKLKAFGWMHFLKLADTLRNSSMAFACYFRGFSHNEKYCFFKGKPDFVIISGYVFLPLENGSYVKNNGRVTISEEQADDPGNPVISETDIQSLTEILYEKGEGIDCYALLKNISTVFNSFSSMYERCLFFAKHPSYFYITLQQDVYLSEENRKKLRERLVINFLVATLSDSGWLHFTELKDLVQQSSLKIKDYFDAFNESSMCCFFRMRPSHFEFDTDTGHVYFPSRKERRMIKHLKTKWIRPSFDSEYPEYVSVIHFLIDELLPDKHIHFKTLLKSLSEEDDEIKDYFEGLSGYHICLFFWDQDNYFEIETSGCVTLSEDMLSRVIVSNPNSARLKENALCGTCFGTKKGLNTNVEIKNKNQQDASKTKISRGCLKRETAKSKAQKQKVLESAEAETKIPSKRQKRKAVESETPTPAKRQKIEDDAKRDEKMSGVPAANLVGLNVPSNVQPLADAKQDEKESHKGLGYLLALVRSYSEKKKSYVSMTNSVGLIVPSSSQPLADGKKSDVPTANLSGLNVHFTVQLSADAKQDGKKSDVCTANLLKLNVPSTGQCSTGVKQDAGAVATGETSRQGKPNEEVEEKEIMLLEDNEVVCYQKLLHSLHASIPKADNIYLKFQDSDWLGVFKSNELLNIYNNEYGIPTLISEAPVSSSVAKLYNENTLKFGLMHNSHLPKLVAECLSGVTFDSFPKMDSYIFCRSRDMCFVVGIDGYVSVTPESATVNSSNDQDREVIDYITELLKCCSSVFVKIPSAGSSIRNVLSFFEASSSYSVGSSNSLKVLPASSHPNESSGEKANSFKKKDNSVQSFDLTNEEIDLFTTSVPDSSRIGDVSFPLKGWNAQSFPGEEEMSSNASETVKATSQFVSENNNSTVLKCQCHLTTGNIASESSKCLLEMLVDTAGKESIQQKSYVDVNRFPEFTKQSFDISEDFLKNNTDLSVPVQEQNIEHPGKKDSVPHLRIDSFYQPSSSSELLGTPCDDSNSNSNNIEQIILEANSSTLTLQNLTMKFDTMFEAFLASDNVEEKRLMAAGISESLRNVKTIHENLKLWDLVGVGDCAVIQQKTVFDVEKEVSEFFVNFLSGMNGYLIHYETMFVHLKYSPLFKKASVFCLFSHLSSQQFKEFLCRYSDVFLVDSRGMVMLRLCGNQTVHDVLKDIINRNSPIKQVIDLH